MARHVEANLAVFAEVADENDLVDLRNCRLNRSVFDRAQLDGTLFSNSDLSGSSFVGSSLVDSKLDVVRALDVRFDLSVLRFARLVRQHRERLSAVEDYGMAAGAHARRGGHVRSEEYTLGGWRRRGRGWHVVCETVPL